MRKILANPRGAVLVWMVAMICTIAGVAGMLYTMKVTPCHQLSFNKFDTIYSAEAGMRYAQSIIDDPSLNDNEKCAKLHNKEFKRSWARKWFKIILKCGMLDGVWELDIWGFGKKLTWKGKKSFKFKSKHCIDCDTGVPSSGSTSGSSSGDTGS